MSPPDPSGSRPSAASASGASAEPIEWTVLDDTRAGTWIGTALVAYVTGSLLAVVARYPLVAERPIGPLSFAGYLAVALLVAGLSVGLLLPVMHRARTRSGSHDGSGRRSNADGTVVPGSGTWSWVDLGLVVGVAAGQLGLVALVGDAALFANAVLAGVLFALSATVLPVVHLLRGEGAYDPRAGTLSFEGRTIELDEIEELRPIALGGLTYLRVRGAADGNAPPGVPMPTETYERLAEDLVAHSE